MSLNPEDASAGAPPSTDVAESATAPPAKELTLMQKSLALVKSTVKELDSVEAGMARMRKRYENVVFNVSTTKGMKEATDARMAIREPRYKVKTALDAGKKQLNTLKGDLTTRAEALIADIMLLETPIHEQIVAEEQRKAKEKEEREAADRQRILAITERIAAIRATATRAAECRTAERVGQILAALEATDMTGFDEFEAEAQAAHTIALDAVRTLHQAKQADEREREERRQAQEAEEARLKKQREELAAQQAAMAAAQKELDDKRAAFEAEQVAAAEAAEAARRAAADAAEAKRLALAETEATTPAPTASQELATAVEWKAPSPGAQVSHQAQLDAYEFLTGQPAASAEDVREQFHQAADAHEAKPLPADSSPAQAALHNLVEQAVAVGREILSEDVREQPDVRLNADLLMEIAVESVASYFEISEAEAVAALASITHWSYRATATA